MKTEFNYGKGGLTVVDLLSVAFIVLKLCKVIDWPWWLVLMPLWVSLGLVAILTIIIIIVRRKRRHLD